MTLALFTLPGGAELIGRITEETAVALTIEHPLVVRPVQRGPNDYVLQLFPHSLANSEGEHQFFISQIVSRSVKVPDRLEAEYTKQTSNIILSSALDDLERLV